ncbi:MAG TPA: ribosome-associated translation inhibitor RaiA [Trebonia sp.]|jgi:ribosomal subunit interface protein|nr:ribosome-associated translation inhibitor RaiA [Trebonia sp.]
MEITFKGRHTSVPERFRRHATVKLAKLEKLDQRAIRIDVEVSTERNPRQADRSERVELTIRSRGPAIRAEAAADDRYAALDLAFAKLEGRLRKAAERRKVRHGDVTVRSTDALAAVAAGPADATAIVAETADLADVTIPAMPQPDDAAMLAGTPVGRKANSRGSTKPAPRAAAKVGSKVNGQRRAESVVPLPAFPQDEGVSHDFEGFRDEAEAEATVSGVLPMQMVGDGPLIVREKFHASHPMTIDDALLEMELVGHDWFAYRDSQCGKFSVVYRRRGYDYGVIRLVDD